jgi:hypothetical protein
MTLTIAYIRIGYPHVLFALPLQLEAVVLFWTGPAVDKLLPVGPCQWYARYLGGYHQELSITFPVLTGQAFLSLL